MADVFGKRLLAEVEVLGFDELLNTLRTKHERDHRWFNCAQIDGILSHITRKHEGPPVLEITSVGAGGGKTHLLYLLTSLAVLDTQHGGRQGAVVIIDAEGNFDVRRLAQQMRHRIESWSNAIKQDAVEDIVKSALQHVHIYKPQSMKGLVECVAGLSEYFLHEQHLSLDRSMSFFAIDSASAFYWQTKAEEETASFSASLPSSMASMAKSEAATTYADLRSAIEQSTKALQCPAIITSRHIGKPPRSMQGELPRQLRPSLPSPMFQLATLRLLVKRVPVRKIPRGLSAADILRENRDRLKVVRLSRFECVVDEAGLNLQDVKTLRATEDGFYFRIKQDGLVIETRVDEQDGDKS